MFIRKPICEFIAFGHKNQNLETTQRGSVGEWIMDWPIHAWKVISNKKEQTMIHSSIQMNLKCIMLSERCQTQKATYCMVPFRCHSEKAKR